MSDLKSDGTLGYPDAAQVALCSSCGLQLTEFSGPGTERGYICQTPGCEMAEVEIERD